MLESHSVSASVIQLLISLRERVCICFCLVAILARRFRRGWMEWASITREWNLRLSLFQQWTTNFAPQQKFTRLSFCMSSSGGERIYKIQRFSGICHVFPITHWQRGQVGGRSEGPNLVVIYFLGLWVWCIFELCFGFCRKKKRVGGASPPPPHPKDERSRVISEMLSLSSFCCCCVCCFVVVVVIVVVVFF